MKYVVKDESGRIMTMVISGNLPEIPGIEILGSASDLNPNDIELEKLSWSEIELEAERQELVSPAIEAQLEKWTKEGEEDVFEQPMVVSEDPELEGALVPDDSWTYVPAVEGVVAVYETIPAIMGMALVEDSAKVLVVRQAKANANLDSIRALREPLLIDADYSINKADDDGLDLIALKTYRKALRECTDSLKKVNGDAKLTCENLVPEEFQFPSKPE